jgi:vitamin B12 transporter
MISRLRTIVFGFAVLAVFPCTAQSVPDSTIVLNEVVIERQRIEDLALGHFSLKIDSAATERNSPGSVADLLRKFGYGHIRSYGQGGLATLSLRGTGAGHSSVLWNGLPLQSPLNGQLDLSQIPVLFIDDAELQMGGSGSINGNGALGGTLHLNGRATFNEGWSFNATGSAASFNTWFGGIGQAWSGKTFSTDTRVFLLDSRNDFPFTNYNLSPPVDTSQQHSSYRQAGILHQDYWQPSTNWLLQARVWLQDNFAELPNPSFVFRLSESDQRDRFIRSMIGAQYTPGRMHFNLQSSFVYHVLHYKQDNAAPVSVSKSNTFTNSLEATLFSTRSLELTGGLSYVIEDGHTEEMTPSHVQRNRAAVFAAIKYNSEKWMASLGARQETLNSKAMPFAPSLGGEFRASNDLRFTGSVSRNYRIPTMNDLYWLGIGAEGNPDLKSEFSWSEEAAANYTHQFNKNTFSFKTTVFSNQVDNWIAWQQGTAIWSPENIKKVWSRGSETQAAFNYLTEEWTISISTLYSYTRSTTQEVYDPFAQNEIGKQLMYTPIHEGNASASGEWKRWKATAIINMTGIQYTDGDNTNAFALDPYQTLNFWLNYDVIGKEVHSTIIVEVNNVFDTSYENREGYPMPGRNYRLTFNIKL